MSHEISKSTPRSSSAKDELRSAFMRQARQYVGVPYSEKHCRPGDENSELFLDCCGLVRRTQQDLEDDFGFRLGPGNQAYQYDTLPVKLELSEMLPGDLIFYSATQTEVGKTMLHDMVHVEIFTGGATGEATLGSRWGEVVSEHQTFRFEGNCTPRYHSIEYHYRSISTWLEGTCRSFCKEHAWDDNQRKERRLEKLYGWSVQDLNGHVSKRLSTPAIVRLPSPPTKGVSNAKRQLENRRFRLALEAVCDFARDSTVPEEAGCEGHCEVHYGGALRTCGTVKSGQRLCSFVTDAVDEQGRFIPCNRQVVTGSHFFCQAHCKFDQMIEGIYSLNPHSMELKKIKDLVSRKRAATKFLKLPSFHISEDCAPVVITANRLLAWSQAEQIAGHNCEL